MKVFTQSVPRLLLPLRSASVSKIFHGWKTLMLHCPSSRVLQHPVFVITNQRHASHLWQPKACTRGKFNNDKSRNNGKLRWPVGAEKSERKSFCFSRVVAVVFAQACMAESHHEPLVDLPVSPQQRPLGPMHKPTSLWEVQLSRPARTKTPRHSCMTLHKNRCYITRAAPLPPAVTD